MAIAYDLEPGDVQLVNNHVLLHARDAFDDAPGRERLLLRVLASVGA
jgi:alpha-ketoglutarate-dependent taurine dioxygenase